MIDPSGSIFSAATAILDVLLERVLLKRLGLVLLLVVDRNSQLEASTGGANMSV
jgi:hypothetical protein